MKNSKWISSTHKKGATTDDDDPTGDQGKDAAMQALEQVLGGEDDEVTAMLDEFGKQLEELFKSQEDDDEQDEE